MLSWVAIQRCYNSVFTSSFSFQNLVDLFFFLVRIIGYTQTLTWVQEDAFMWGGSIFPKVKPSYILGTKLEPKETRISGFFPSQWWNYWNHFTNLPETADDLHVLPALIRFLFLLLSKSSVNSIILHLVLVLPSKTRWN